MIFFSLYMVEEKKKKFIRADKFVANLLDSTFKSHFSDLK